MPTPDPGGSEPAVALVMPLVHYWHDAAHPDYVAEALASFRVNNPDLEQLVFDEVAAEEFILERHGPRQAAAFRACAVPAMQADYFRYCAVHTLGGVYADANFCCLASLGQLTEGPAAGMLFGRIDPVPSQLAAAYGWPYPVGAYRAVSNGLFGFREPGHPLLELAIEAATRNIESRVAETPAGVWLATGPGIFTSLYLLRELESIDAFLEYSLGSAIEPSAPLLCEAIGGLDRIRDMWRGVDILTLEQRDSWVVKSEKRPTGASWLRRDGAIYR